MEIEIFEMIKVYVNVVNWCFESCTQPRMRYPVRDSMEDMTYSRILPADLPPSYDECNVDRTSVTSSFSFPPPPEFE